MSFPSSYPVSLSGSVGVGLGGGLSVGVTSIPTIHLAVDTLPDIHLSVDKLPKIQLGLDPIEIRLTRLPDLRVQLPMKFCVGLSVLGMELMNVGLCGEAQVITEPYQPNPCEVCGPLEGRHLLGVAELDDALSSWQEEAP